MANSAEVKQERARLLRKLLTLLLTQAIIVSTLCYAFGVVGILLLPAISKETYVDENALSPGMAVAGGQYDNIQSLIVGLGQTSKERVQDWVVRQLRVLNKDFCSHSFAPPPSSRYSAPSNQSSSSLNTRQAPVEPGLGQNVVGVVRAPKGQGNECLVLVTPVTETRREADAIAIAISYGVFRHLATVPWLAKDVIWVIADGRYGADYALSSWLSDYHSPQTNFTGRFLRGGAIQAAVALEIDPGYRTGAFDLVELRAEGPNGEMPNLDMISTVTFLNRYQPTQGGLRFKLSRWRGLSKVLGPLLPLLRWAAGEIGRTAAHEYDRHVEMLAACMHRQAVGASLGVHGAFRRYTIDALTLVAKPSGSNRDLADQTSASAAAARRDQAGSILKISRLLEGYFRCLNNLLERLHHSSSLYVLASPTRFVSIGDYMIPFALLLVTLPLTAAALATQGYKGFCPGPSAGAAPKNRKGVEEFPPGGPEKHGGVGGVYGSGERAIGDLAGAKGGFSGSDEQTGVDVSCRKGIGSSAEDAHSELRASGLGAFERGSKETRVTRADVLLVPTNWTRAVATVVVTHLGGVLLWRISPSLLHFGAALSHWLQTPIELTSAAVWVAAAAIVLTAAVFAMPSKTGQIIPPAGAVGARSKVTLSKSPRRDRERVQYEILRAEKIERLDEEEKEMFDGVEKQLEGESSLRTLRADWVALKSATLAAAGLALGALVNLDYALALLSAVCLVPICLVARPLQLNLPSFAVPSGSLNASFGAEPFEAEEVEGGKTGRNDAATTGIVATGQRNARATQVEGLGVAQSQSQSALESESEGQTPSMAALCAHVREELTRIRQSRQEARENSGLCRLKSAVAVAVRWVLDKRRVVRERVKERLGRDGVSAPSSPRKAAARQIVLTVAALLLTPGPFLVLACEQGKAPDLRVLFERVKGSDSVAMSWLIAGYLPILALSVRTLSLPPVTRD